MCTACQVSVTNPDKATEAFMADLLETLNRSALGLALSIGHRTGLFDTLAELGEWATSERIAEAAGLQERYVREWLASMVTGGVVAYDEGRGVYRLPDHHAAALTRAAAENNLASVFQFLSVMGEVEDDIVRCFREGGGVPYERYHRFHEVMAEESAGTVVAGLFDHILPLVPGITERLEEGIDVLDIGCGAGRALCAMAERYPASRFLGRDLCESAVAMARQQAQEKGLTNVRFETADVSQPGEPEAFDLITAFDVIHDQRDPAAVLANVRRMLRPGGTFLMQDLKASSNLHENIGHPLCPFFYVISTMHCMTVSLAQGGAGLGSAWGEQLAVRMLGEAGFKDIKVQQLPHDIQNNWYVMSKAASPAAVAGA